MTNTHTRNDSPSQLELTLTQATRVACRYLFQLPSVRSARISLQALLDRVRASLAFGGLASCSSQAVFDLSTKCFGHVAPNNSTDGYCYDITSGSLSGEPLRPLNVPKEQ